MFSLLFYMYILYVYFYTYIFVHSLVLRSNSFPGIECTPHEFQHWYLLEFKTQMLAPRSQRVMNVPTKNTKKKITTYNRVLVILRETIDKLNRENNVI